MDALNLCNQLFFWYKTCLVLITRNRAKTFHIAYKKCYCKWWQMAKHYLTNNYCSFCTTKWYMLIHSMTFTCIDWKVSKEFSRFLLQFYRPKQSNWEFWLWKFSHFPATLILHEINFGWFLKVKNYYLNNFEGCEF